MHNIIIGPLPPPHHGMSKNLKKFVDDCGAEKNTIINTSPKKLQRNYLYKLIKIKNFLSGITRTIYHSTKKETKMYITLDGDKGLILSCCYILVYGLRKKDIYIHHRSYNYIRNKRRILQHLTENYKICNIFLSNDQMEKFKSNYSSDINMIISNAHYVIDEIDKEEKTKNKKTVLLHLSNLSIEKGLSRYIEVVKFLCEKGEYEFILAGPFNSKEDEEYFKNTNESVKKKINYLGPIYGKEKNEILSKTDILLFPSKYKNEAEPNVIYEAQSFGAFTIAYDYASIKEQLSEASGMLIPIDRNYAQEAVITINKINNNEITIDSDKIKNELKHKATINKAEYQKLIEIFK